MNKRGARSVWAVACSSLALVILLSYTTHYLRGTATGVDAETIQRIDACLMSSPDPTFKSRCLQNALSLLLTTHTPAQLLATITASTTPSQIRDQCHPIAHLLGAETYEKYNSVEAALSQCTNDCRYGCTHGVISAGVLAELGADYSEDDIAHADTAELRALGAGYCASGQSTCHAMGHVGYIATGDTATALQLCDDIGTNLFTRESCYEGTFMERAGNFLNTVLPSGIGKRPETKGSDYTFPCSSLAPRYRHACFLFLPGYQGSLFQADAINTPALKLDKETAVCTSLNSRDRASCFEGVGASSITFGFDNARDTSLTKLCSSLPSKEDTYACTLGVLSQFLFTEKENMLQYCASITEQGARTLCYNASFQWNEVREGAHISAETLCGSSGTCLDQYRWYSEHMGSLPMYRFGLFGQTD